MTSFKLTVAPLIISGTALGDLSHVSYTVETVVAGYDTYQIFLNFTNPADQLLAVGGDEAGGNSALSYTGGELYNGAFDGLNIPDDTGMLANLPGMEGDSYLTIGGEGELGWTDTQFSPGFLDANVDGFGNKVGGSSFICENDGGYFDSNPETGNYDTGSGVLVAQLTVATGEEINFAGTAFFYPFNSNGEGATESFALSVPAPGVLALLGLTGRGRRCRV